jgi:hypothetical protein
MNFLYLHQKRFFLLCSIFALLQTGQAESFLQWAQTHQLSSSGILEQADSDGDGLRNLVEYATGSDPSVHSPSPLAISAGSTNIHLSYPRRTDRDELTIQLQATGSLISNDVECHYKCNT